MLVVVEATVVEGVVVDGTVVVAAVVDDDGGGSRVVVVGDEFAGEQAERSMSVAIAAPRRLNDRKESPSPINSRRGLTGLPPILVTLPNIHFLEHR